MQLPLQLPLFWEGFPQDFGARVGEFVHTQPKTYLRGQALMLYKKARLILSPWIEVTDQVNPVLLYQTHLLNNK